MSITSHAPSFFQTDAAVAKAEVVAQKKALRGASAGYPLSLPYGSKILCCVRDTSVPAMSRGEKAVFVGESGGFVRRVQIGIVSIDYLSKCPTKLIRFYSGPR
jgi:hypothetical protein